MTGGSSAPATGTWIDVPPGCTLEPVWFQWWISTGGAEGAVAPTNRSATNFTGVIGATGTTTIEVASLGSVDCGANRTSVVRTANATFHVDAPLDILGFHTAVAPAGPPARVVAVGVLVGGDPPFSLAIDWGDGNVTNASRPSDGSFAIAGGGRPGGGQPIVTATDAAGLTARARSEENATASDGFVIALTPSSWTAEVGLPVSFRIAATVPSSNYSTISVCEDDPVGPLARSDALPGGGFSCTFASAGTANVSVVAVEESFPFAVSTAELHEPVAAPFAFAVGAPSELHGEVGRAAYVPISVTGGVAPIRLEWRFVGNDSEATSIVDRDGSYFAPVTPTVPGTEPVEVSGADALGMPSENASVSLAVEAPLAGQAAVGATPAPGGTELQLSASIVSGVPPFDWAVEENVPLANSTGFGGTLPSAGPFGWSATVRAEGPQTPSLIVVDSLGAVWTYRSSVDAVPPLGVELRAAASGSDLWTAVVELTGGAPPLSFQLNSSDGTSFNRTGLTDGSYRVMVRASSGGNLSLRVTALDRWGVSARATAWVAVTGGPAPAGFPAGSLAVGSAVALGIGGGLAFWRYRRHSPGIEAPPVDPISILRGIIAPADGADRGVVELLAEEQGVSLAEVRSTIDRLVSAGTILSERGADGEEILAWRPLP